MKDRQGPHKQKTRLTTLMIAISLCQMSPSQDQTEAKLQTKVWEVPEVTINIGDPTRGLPLERGAFRLQGSNSESQDNSQLSFFRPIGEALIDEKGTVFASFPSLDLIARFSAPEYNTVLLGAKKRGGNGLPLIKPGTLAVVESKLFCANGTTGMVLEINSEGKLENVPAVQGHGTPLPIPGPALLATKPEASYLFATFDLAGRPRRLFGRGRINQAIREKNHIPFANPQWFAGMSNGDILFAAPNGEMLLHFGANGLIKTKFNFAYLHPTGQVTVGGLGYAQNAYWLLLHQNGRPWMLVRFTAIVTHAESWILSFPADGMYLGPNQLILYHRQSGHIETYKLPNLATEDADSSN